MRIPIKRSIQFYNEIKNSYEQIVNDFKWKFRQEQLDAIIYCVEVIMDEDVKGVFSEIPFAFGKTFVQCFLACYHASKYPETRFFIITPRKDLQHTTIKTCNELKKFFNNINPVLLKGKQNYLSMKTLFHEKELYKDELNSEFLVLDTLNYIEKLANQYSGDLDFIFADGELEQKIEKLDNEIKFSYTQEHFGISYERPYIENELGENDEMKWYDLARQNVKLANPVIANHALFATQVLLMSRNVKDPFLDYSNKNIVTLIDEADRFPQAVLNLMNKKVSIYKILRNLSCSKRITAKSFKKESKRIENIYEQIRDIEKEISKCIIENDGIIRIAKAINGPIFDMIGKASCMYRLVDEAHDILKKVEKKEPVIGNLIQKLNEERKDFNEFLHDSERILNGNYVKETIDKKEIVSCFAVTITPKEKHTCFERVQAECGGFLKVHFWDKVNKTILMSGTLADPLVIDKVSFVQQKFQWGAMSNKLNLKEKKFKNPLDLKMVNVYLVNGTYRFKFNNDMELNEEVREEKVKDDSKYIAEVIIPQAKGGIVICCTSYRDCILFEQYLKTTRKIIVQHPEESLYKKIEEYENDTTNNILISPNLWVGINLPGTKLSDMIVPRFPIEPPNSPSAILKRQKYGIIYTLSETSIKCKQGFGRVKRNEEDTGNIWILDWRYNEPMFSLITRYLLNTYNTVEVEWKNSNME